MDTSLLICDHSYHYKSFSHNLKGGLQNYLFRLQTEGSCEVTSHGKEYTLSGGDLLLLRPGDDYQLTVKEPTIRDACPAETIICSAKAPGLTPGGNGGTVR